MHKRDHNDSLSIKRRFFGLPGGKPWPKSFYLVHLGVLAAAAALIWTVGWLVGIPWDWGPATLVYYLGLPPLGVFVAFYELGDMRMYQWAGVLLGQWLEPRHLDGLSDNRDPKRLYVEALVSVRRTPCDSSEDLPPGSLSRITAGCRSKASSIT